MQTVVSLMENMSLGLELAEFLKTNGNALRNPYHGIFHGFRVCWSAVDAMIKLGGDAKQVRTAAVAGLFHDWRHPGVSGTDDSHNVEIAALKVESMRDGGRFCRMDAAQAIRETRFPYLSDPLGELGRILRDADIWHMGFLTEDEFLQIQVGLAAEMGVDLGKWVVGNAEFISGAATWTKWGEGVARESRGRLVGWCRKWGERLED